MTVGLIAAVVVSGLAAQADPSVARSVSQTPRSGYASTERVIALTFDDGPHPVYTPRILDALDRYGVQAAFFMVGREAARYPSIVRRAAAAGHGIGGHTWNHVDLRGLSVSRFSYEVDRTNALLATLPSPDRTIRCVRPPFGAYDSTVVDRLADRGLATTLWSVDPRDWRRPGAAAIVSRTLEGLHPGAVVLLHDGGGDRSQTVRALPSIIRGIRERGYRIVPICWR